MTTNLEKKIDFFSEDTLCYISDTKVFKYYESHFLILMLQHFQTDLTPLAIPELEYLPTHKT